MSDEIISALAAYHLVVLSIHIGFMHESLLFTKVLQAQIFSDLQPDVTDNAEFSMRIEVKIYLYRY